MKPDALIASVLFLLGREAKYGSDTPAATQAKIHLKAVEEEYEVIIQRPLTVQLDSRTLLPEPPVERPKSGQGVLVGDVMKYPCGANAVGVNVPFQCPVHRDDCHAKDPAAEETKPEEAAPVEDAAKTEDAPEPDETEEVVEGQ